MRRARSRARPSLLRLSIAALFVAVAVPTIVVASGGAVFADLQPSLAVRFNPWNARALAHLAEYELAAAPGDDAVRRRATTFARRSLAQDPTLAFSWRTLGLVAASTGADRLAVSLFGVSERLSRRDAPTRFWLIEREVQRGDVPAALKQYDIALRTSPASYDILLPILVAAAGDPQVVPQLGRLLAQRPQWANNYFYRLSESPPDPTNVAALLEQARRGGPLLNPEMLRGLIPRMIDRQAYPVALRIAAALDGPAARLPKAVWGERFDQPGSLAPLDWSLTSTEGLGAEIRAVASGKGQALVADAGSDNGGTVARQILMLSPGAYQLVVQAHATDRPPATLRSKIDCAAPAKAALSDRSLEPRAVGTPGVTRFVVPQACPAQWLSLDIQAHDPEGGEVAIDRVAVLTSEGRPIR